MLLPEEERNKFSDAYFSPVSGGEVDPVDEVPVVILGNRASSLPPPTHLVELTSDNL